MTEPAVMVTLTGFRKGTPSRLDGVTIWREF